CPHIRRLISNWHYCFHPLGLLDCHFSSKQQPHYHLHSNRIRPHTHLHHVQKWSGLWHYANHLSRVFYFHFSSKQLHFCSHWIHNRPHTRRLYTQKWNRQKNNLLRQLGQLVRRFSSTQPYYLHNRPHTHL